MRFIAVLSLVAASVAFAATGGPDRERSSLCVLYVGEVDAKRDRSEGFMTFLRERFRSVRSETHQTLDVEAVEGADVVLLDWHAGNGEYGGPSPLGNRATWRKPTVTVGRFTGGPRSWGAPAL